MTVLLKGAVLAVFVLLNTGTYRQKVEAAEKLLSKTWQIKSVDINGKRQPKGNEWEGGKLIFNKNYVFEEDMDGERMVVGTWSYNALKKEITIIDNGEEETATMRVIMLEENNLVLDVDEYEEVMRFYLQPSK